ncbi:MAG: ATP-binding cassette domain-containing protein [Paludibacteraceae bacterium]|nr:ATP-binding cassette domain-containing protein [Paludibacteraceae bacterium]MBR2493252.1 ATP-binding cassette domain-containing protein [Paludibacteraceae bacterium]MBR3872137.1 ATP-binding cassette domain-containing protein [Paludibacteraceae bacterium]MBR6687047.1 ATP-binding cassette domain-containing protein [Paludibacteraceae bacterium]
MSTQTNNTLIKYSGVEICQKEQVVLKDVSLEISTGEFYYLIGTVGSGKSSLLKTIYAELPITDGEGQVFDFDLNKITQKDIPFLRRKIGIIFQDFQLLMDRTVYENLLFVLKATDWKDKDAMNKRIEEVLNEVGMNTKGYKMPHELSGGEQQRIVIARALLNKPKLILADEPTGNLDPATGNAILELLQGISEKENTTVIMATHNLGLLETYPGKVLKVENNRLLV